MNPGDWRNAVEPVGQSIIAEPKGWRTTVTPKGWRAKTQLKDHKSIAKPREGRGTLGGPAGWRTTVEPRGWRAVVEPRDRRAQDDHLSFPPSGTVQYSSLWYAIFAISIVSCEC